ASRGQRRDEWVTPSDPLFPNFGRLKQKLAKRGEGGFGKIERFGNKKSSARILCLRTNRCLAYDSREESMSATTNVSKGGAGGFARQLGNLFHRHSMGEYLYG